MKNINLRIKRIYDGPDIQDGYRILVDRLWPRGLLKIQAKIDLWSKDIAPSNELRRWFSHDARKWQTFRQRYKKELKAKTALLKGIIAIGKQHKTITLLYSARDTLHNNATVLRDYLVREFAAKEKLEIVLSAPVQGEAGGRGVWGEFRPPSPVSSVRIFSNRHHTTWPFLHKKARTFFETQI